MRRSSHMAEDQYLNLSHEVLNFGEDVFNERTGKSTRVVIGRSLIYNASEENSGVLTTKKTFWKPAIAEMLGYMRGYNNASDFRKLGCNTWNANANENSSWINNPNRLGEDDMGYCYGAVGSSFRNLDGTTTNQWDKVVNHLKNKFDDRDETITFRHPGTEHLACLRPCMHTHTFSSVNGKLYLTSAQRSVDIPLGLPFNMIQVIWLLRIMAQITGHEPAAAKHDLINCHIYEDQLDLMSAQLDRKPYNEPKLKINPDIKSWDDLMTWVTLDDFELIDYQHHPAIKYPFSV